jgi:hypothetical protein
VASVWKSIKETAKSLGGAAVAPAGVVWDLSTMPFDDKADTFGSVAHALSSRVGDAMDPIFNPSTLTGGVITHALEGMNWALVNGVSEPISAFTYATAHASQNDVGAGALFDGATWSKAYDMAQRDNAGQALAWGLTSSNNDDPFQYKSPYDEETAKDHTILGPALSYGMNTVGAFFLDPAVIGGKALGAGREAYQFRGLGTTDKANFYDLVTRSSRASALKPNLASRTDKWLDWTEGNNALKRPLTAPEILHGTPELKRMAAEPEVLAGLLADTNKISTPALRRDAKRRILAVAAGDTTQIARLRGEVADSAAIADTLTNMVNKSTIDLRALAMNPALRTNPAFVERLETQLDHLNSDRAVDKFMDGWNTRLDQLLEIQHTMPNAPGVHTAGKRAILRQNDQGLLRAPANIHKGLDDWAAQRALKAQSASSLFQKGLYSVPVVAVKTVGFMASPYTKAPVAITDALRQSHFTGVANLHDWGGSAAQLDSMMRLSNVSPGDRLKTLSEAYLASSEAEKMNIIGKVEGLSMKSLAREFSTRSGRPIDEDYITKLMEEYAAKKGTSLAHIRGRAYAATEMPPEMAAVRGQSAQNATDAARMEGKGFSAPASDKAGKWRVDQINDDGTPLSLPLLESQLANSVPLMDMGVARKLLERDHQFLSRISRAWKDESLELGRLTELKAAGAQGLDKAVAARAASADMLVSAGQSMMRGWKFSVLFRLGYPVRVLMDDHMRIWTQMNAATFYGENSKELLTNWRYNNFARRNLGREQLHSLKTRRQEILDEMQGERMVAHTDRQAQVKSLQASARGHRAQATKLRQQIEEAQTKRSLGIDSADIPALKARLAESERSVMDAEGGQQYLLEQLGEYGPADLQRELDSIEETIRGGSKALAPEKRGIGSADVVLDKKTGDAIQGAFGGDFGQAVRGITSSHGSFENQLVGVEDRMFRASAGGSHRTIQPDEAGHLNAWADVLNNQFKSSAVAMHFVNGGDVNGFVRWVNEPAQGELRKRLAHYAHDPEDWGHRVESLVHDYIPSEELRDAVATGRVKPKQLARMFQDPSVRPAVHGRTVADNIGSSAAAQAIGNTMNRMYKMLGEMPTDRLSRHPYFNSLYRQHAKDVYAVQRVNAREFTQRDFDDISRTARKLALRDLKKTLFDVSAHSHAAHVLRFISPFFAAHQEGVARWWRIAADNPAVIRRFAQGFDVPRYLAVEVDGDGNLVKPGAPLSRDHRVLLQLPKAFGGPDPEVEQSKWTVSEQSFNLVLQGGLTNPGTGPIVSVPLEWAAQKYADDPTVARIARVFNPFPPQSPMEAMVPATLKRLSAYTYGKTGTDLMFGIGKREYNASFSQNVQDLMVDFQLKNGREPSRQESTDLVERAGREATTEMFHRVLWNSLSPAPASPQSKYSAVQHGWYTISAQARTQGKDFSWAYEQFKDKWGEAYMPLVYSTSNNPAFLDANAATVAGIKRYKGLLSKVDPALSKVVIGAYADDLIANNATLGDYSSDARNYLRNEQMSSGSSDTYYSYDEPKKAADEQMARRGWQKYGELTGALTAMAQGAGMSTYMQSPPLMALKRAGVEQLRSENYAFDQEYGTFDTTKYDRYIDGLRVIASAPVLAKDTDRTDIQALGAYLQLRDMFTAALDAREKAGFGGMEAQANQGMRAAFTALVGALVESNTYFETHIFNGVVEKDPYLVTA